MDGLPPRTLYGTLDFIVAPTVYWTEVDSAAPVCGWYASSQYIKMFTRGIERGTERDSARGKKGEFFLFFFLFFFTLSPRRRPTLLVHCSPLCVCFPFFFSPFSPFWSIGKEWRYIKRAHTAPLRHKALLQSYLCPLSLDKGALTLRCHQAFFIRRMAVFD